MRVKVIEEKPDFMAFEVSGLDVSIIDVVSERINALEDAEYFGYREEHPLTGVITVTMKTRPGAPHPRELLKKELRELGQLMEKLLEEAERL
ncbi:MAG: RpoL/Rpb11 RNA polymerase subunit family protein [Nitrososphaerota archaeon]